MPQNEKLKYGLAGLVIGAAADLFHIFLHYMIFRRNLPLGQYIRAHILTFGPGMLTNIFIAGTVFAMGGAGILVGKLREKDAQLQREWSRKISIFRGASRSLKTFLPIWKAGSRRARTSWWSTPES